jgi:hypothetical protein
MIMKDFNTGGMKVFAIVGAWRRDDVRRSRHAGNALTSPSRRAVGYRRA